MRFNLTSPVLRRSVLLRPASLARGFTLLEVLVAIVVLSFGVLGVVGLQAAALQANKDARYQSTAIAMARELGDLMRGNKDLAITAGNPYLIDVSAGATLTTTDNCFTSTCTTTVAVANHHIREWLARVQTALPGVRVVVCFDDTPYASGGTPVWACNNASTLGMAVVKMGWTRQGYNRSAAQPERAVAPVVVLPLIPGSAT